MTLKKWLGIELIEVSATEKLVATLGGGLSPPTEVYDEEDPPPTHEEILAALRSLDSFVDISEDDLIQLTKLLGQRARTLAEA